MQKEAILCVLLLACILSSTHSIRINVPFIRKTPITTLSTSSIIHPSHSRSLVSTATHDHDHRESRPQPRKKNQVLNFLAGGLAGMLASSITIPLEVVKTQLQTSTKAADMTALSICKKILHQSGPKGFFKGLQPLLIGIIPTRAIYFWSYSATKNALAQTKLKDSSWGHLVSAFVAGFASNTFSNPIWMVRTRYQILADQSLGQKAYGSYLDAIKYIHKEEGIAGFYKGLTASYAGCFEGAIQWMIYEKLKSKFIAKEGNVELNDAVKRRRDEAVKLFAIAALSKFSAIALTYPHEVVRTRMREQAINGIFKYSGFFQTLRCIAAEEGIRGLYGGMGMHLLRSVPNAAIMVSSYELISNWLDRNSETHEHPNKSK